MSNNQDSVFGDVIYTFTRAQAIEDGVLVDLSRQPVMRTFWTHPVACTSTVWSEIESAVNDGADLDGVLHDICWLAKCSISQNRSQGTDQIHFTVSLNGQDQSLKLHIGPGDTAAPVLTLMFANES